MATIIARPVPPSCRLSVAPSSLSRRPKPWSEHPATRSGGASDGMRTANHEPRTNKSSAHALAKLTRRPVFMASLPRFHVKPRGVDGTLVVVDRASDEQFKVYTPRFMSQFRAGHRSGLWYLRPAGDLGLAPRSSGFRAASDAVEAIRSLHWDPSPTPMNRRRARCRIIW
jgi:hypothetical protein